MAIGRAPCQKFPASRRTAFPTASHVLGSKLDSIPFSPFHLGVIFVLGFVALVDGYDGSMTGTLLVLAKKPLHITPGEIRLLAVASSLAACVGGFTAAAISDHWSRRTVMLLGVAAINFFTLLIPLAQSGEQLIAIRLLTGLAIGFAASAPFPIAAELMPAQHRRTYGAIYEMMLASSFTLVPLVGFLVAGNPNGFRLLALPAVLGLFVVPVLVYRLIPESPRWYLRRGNPEAAVDHRQPDHRPVRQSRGAADGHSARARTSAPAREQLPSFSALFRRGQLRWTVVGIVSLVCAQVSFFTISILLPKALIDQGAAVTLSFGLSSLVFLASIPGEGLYRVPDGDHRAAMDDRLLPRRIASRPSDDGGGAFRGALRDRRVCRRSADHRLHRAVDLYGRAGVSLRAVPDGAARSRAVFWRVVRAVRRRRDRAVHVGAVHRLADDILWNPGDRCVDRRLCAGAVWQGNRRPAGNRQRGGSRTGLTVLLGRCFGIICAARQIYPCVAWLPTSVTVDMPHGGIGFGAMRMAFTGLDIDHITNINIVLSCSVATMPEPEVTISSWSQLWICHPVVPPWLKLTTLQL